MDAVGSDGLVCDLDGTLVRLTVDWDVVACEAASALEAVGLDPPSDLWEMLVRAEETGHRDAVETVIAGHEREGARASERLPAADCLLDLDGHVAVGVCSLNCAEACHIALDRHELAGRVDAVVGRDSVPGQKPDPEPLLATVDELGVGPDRVLFVGDSERDAVTADRAGVRFVHVEDWLQRA